MWLIYALSFLILALVCWWTRHDRSTARWRLLAALALLAGIAAALTVPSATILQKLANRVAMPCGIVWFGLLAVLIYAIKQAQWRTASLLGAVIVIYSLLGNDWIAHRLAARLEAPYANVQPFETGHYDAVFVLGGSTGTTPSGIAQLDWSGDRVMLAARMYERGQIDYLITTGQRIEGLHMLGRDPSIETAEMWQDLGVPEAKILMLEGRNTREEMQNIQALQNEHHWQRVGVITSASHLPRALRLAERAQLKLEPLPCNFEGDETPWTELSLVPDSASMFTNHKALKEYLARAVGE